MRDPDVVIVCCGGGGLLAGIAAAIRLQQGNSSTRVYGVEPETGRSIGLWKKVVVYLIE